MALATFAAHPDCLTAQSAAQLRSHIMQSAVCLFDYGAALPSLGTAVGVLLLKTLAQWDVKLESVYLQKSVGAG